MHALAAHARAGILRAVYNSHDVGQPRVVFVRTDFETALPEFRCRRFGAGYVSFAS